MGCFGRAALRALVGALDAATEKRPQIEAVCPVWMAPALQVTI